MQLRNLGGSGDASRKLVVFLAWYLFAVAGLQMQEAVTCWLWSLLLTGSCCHDVTIAADKETEQHYMEHGWQSEIFATFQGPHQKFKHLPSQIECNVSTVSVRKGNVLLWVPMRG